MSLASYVPLVPPFELDYDNWTSAKASEYLSWFVERVPERAEYITAFVSKEIRRPGLAKKSPKRMLRYIWRWFIKVMETEPLNEDELALLEPIRMKYGEESAMYCTKRLTTRTEYIVRDIGMLFAQLLLDQSSRLTWKTVSKPKNYVFVNRPILTGFLDTRYNPAFEAETDPIHLVGVQAAKALTVRLMTDMDLVKVFDFWSACIPK